MPTKVTIFGYEVSQSSARIAARIASWCRGHSETQREFCHWTIRFSYGNDRIQVVQFVRDEHGNLTAKTRVTCRACARRLERSAIHKINAENMGEHLSEAAPESTN
ncbi:hypothetical protein MTO96_006650 [Rhipicephalus appendiculatus]